MLEFAVRLPGVHEDDQGCWVLAVEQGKLLLAYPDNSLHWHAVEDCKFLKLMPPDTPRQRVMLAPRPGPTIAVPNGKLN